MTCDHSRCAIAAGIVTILISTCLIVVLLHGLNVNRRLPIDLPFPTSTEPTIFIDVPTARPVNDPEVDSGPPKCVRRVSHKLSDTARVTTCQWSDNRFSIVIQKLRQFITLGELDIDEYLAPVVYKSCMICNHCRERQLSRLVLIRYCTEDVEKFARFVYVPARKGVDISRDEYSKFTFAVPDIVRFISNLKPNASRSEWYNNI